MPALAWVLLAFLVVKWAVLIGGAVLFIRANKEKP